MDDVDSQILLCMGVTPEDVLGGEEKEEPQPYCPVPEQLFFSVNTGQNESEANNYNYTNASESKKRAREEDTFGESSRSKRRKSMDFGTFGSQNIPLLPASFLANEDDDDEQGENFGSNYPDYDELLKHLGFDEEHKKQNEEIKKIINEDAHYSQEDLDYLAYANAYRDRAKKQHLWDAEEFDLLSRPKIDHSVTLDGIPLFKVEAIKREVRMVKFLHPQRQHGQVRSYDDVAADRTDWCELFDSPEGKALLVHSPWYSHGPFILRVICYALDFFESLKMQLRVVPAVAICRNEITQYLLGNQMDIEETILRAISKWLSNNKISQKQKNQKKAFVAPYFKAPCLGGYLNAPVFNPSVRLNHVPRTPEEWKRTEKQRMHKSVVRSCFQKKMFLLESQYEQKLLDFGFNVQDISGFAIHWQNFEKKLWRLELINNMSRRRRNSKAKALLRTFMFEEEEKLKHLIQCYAKIKKNVECRVIAKSSDPEITAVINVHDIMTQKHKEFEAILLERLNRSNVDLKLVDWEMVAKDVASTSHIRGTADACERAYRLELSPLYNNIATLSEEVEALQAVTGTSKKILGYIDWNFVLKAFENSFRRSPIRIFRTWRNHIDKKIRNPFRQYRSLRNKMITKIRKCKGNVAKAIIELTPKYGEMSYNQICIQWATWNRKQKLKGPFSVNEDAVLLVAAEVVAANDQEFEDISAALPWRYCSRWRNRIEVLLQNQITPFTLEEDKLILKLVSFIGTKWSSYVPLFQNKTRKQLAGRYRWLNKKLKTMALEEYHILYSLRKPRNGTSIVRLQKVGEVLRKAILMVTGLNKSKTLAVTGGTEAKLSSNHGLELTRRKEHKEYRPLFKKDKPNEEELFEYLCTFGPRFLMSAFQSVVNYLTENKSKTNGNLLAIEQTVATTSSSSRIHGLSSENSSNNLHAFICDRRKFDLSNPMSVASALQLRGVPLQKKRKRKLSDFENKIYSYYRMFESRYRTKKGAYRSGIPTVKELAQIPELQNIIILPKSVKKSDAVVKKEDIYANLFNQGEDQNVLPGELENNPPHKKKKTESNAVIPFLHILNITGNSLVPAATTSHTIVCKDGSLKDIRGPPKRYNRDKNAPRGKMKKTLVKEQRREAAKARWSKQKIQPQVEVKVERSLDCPIMQYEVPSPLSVLKEEALSPSSMITEDVLSPGVSWVTGSPSLGKRPLLTVLHDHNYPKNYKQWKADVESELNTVDLTS